MSQSQVSNTRSYPLRTILEVILKVRLESVIKTHLAKAKELHTGKPVERGLYSTLAEAFNKYDQVICVTLCPDLLNPCACIWFWSVQPRPNVSPFRLKPCTTAHFQNLLSGGSKRVETV